MTITKPSRRITPIAWGFAGGLFQILLVSQGIGLFFSFGWVFFLAVFAIRFRQNRSSEKGHLADMSLLAFFSGGVVVELVAIVRYFLIGGSMETFVGILSLSAFFWGVLAAITLVFVGAQYLIRRMWFKVRHA